MATEQQTTKPGCVFCNVTAERGFNIVWEDDHYVAFTDRSPAATHHVLLVPKKHIDNIKSLHQTDVALAERMAEIGHTVLDQLNVPQDLRRMGFVIPPFNSVNHLHLHILGLPFTSTVKSIMYRVSSGTDGNDKGFSWFGEVNQVIGILKKGGSVNVFAC
ncbi:HIT-like protein [Irpex rosettiformis]|uniref:HIT-like protein n=1 Tax=Irpex rosettiformis TaxID=378272 RepID=A0ACB8UB15_9APHY|nr:HIT-like protein [Irpex rosettiformis]